MSNEGRSIKSAFSGFGRELLDGARGVASAKVDEAFSSGFAAANLCRDVVTDTTDALLAKIRTAICSLPRNSWS